MVLERNEIILNRYRKISEMRAEGIDPFPHKFDPTHKSKEILDNAEELIKSKEKVRVAGRIMSIRSFGKAAFFHIMDGVGRIQIHIRKGSTPDRDREIFQRYIDSGDIVGVEGEVFRTKTGEVTVLAERLVLLAKAVRPLPEKWHGLRDREIRYRQRYVDLIVNEDVRRTFIQRTQIINSMRQYLNEKGYLEVETPMMQPVYGGAMARPFITHHHALDMTLYLRIAPELYHKRLVVGGFEKVYEINRNFRNEGISTVHNPEFTMLELYTAYWDYRDTLLLVEDLLKHIAREVLGTLTFTYDKDEIDFSGEWQRLTILEAIKKHTGIELNWDQPQQEVLRVVAPVVEASAKELQELTTDELIMLLFESKVEEQLIQPTFVMEFPRSLSPLAKASADNPAVAERFELFIARLEIANAYTELNDPEEQYEIFKEQARKRQDGVVDAFMMDEDYIRALEYGLPPTSGLGIGIDRLVMLLTNRQSIREVILFPHLRPERPEDNPETV
ncbi:lysine--tRNA ligase [Candidatus Sumerlaeota bacterium]|nr:lysine--tRNA ligase [Candidatus Sumerlaeota bacterium]